LIWTFGIVGFLATLIFTALRAPRIVVLASLEVPVALAMLVLWWGVMSQPSVCNPGVRDPTARVAPAADADHESLSA
jgi:hypothetical protein